MQDCNKLSGKAILRKILVAVGIVEAIGTDHSYIKHVSAWLLL